MPKSTRSQPPDAPKPSSGEPTRRVVDAVNAAEETWDLEIDVDGRPTPEVPAPTDPWAEPPTHATTLPMGEVPPLVAAATVKPDRPALRRNSTDSGLGAGVPGPSFGGDTDFDATDEHPTLGLRDTSAFESRPRQNIAMLSEPPGQPLGFAFDEGSDAAADALDLVGRQATSLRPAGEPPRNADPLGELRERYALGDFSGALTVAEALLEDDPTNADVQRYAESCRDVLKQMYTARLGSLEQVPMVGVPTEQLRWLTLDHRAGFLLSHVDGVSTLEEILDISGMPHLEAMRIIYELLQQKVILFQ